jgi:hypothetical protein
LKKKKKRLAIFNGTYWLIKVSTRGPIITNKIKFPNVIEYPLPYGSSNPKIYIAIQVKNVAIITENIIPEIIICIVLDL